MKVCLRPRASQLSPSNGIGRVVHAQYKHLPKLGIEFVENPNEADLCVGHTDTFDMPRLDVLHSHGIYWLGDKGSGNYGAYELNANQAVRNAARLAHTITVPSKWVAMPFKRDMRISPIVIGHGIDLDTFVPKQEPDDYLLWAKNRMADVCNPIAAYEMAKRGHRVVSTYGPRGVPYPDNFMVIGAQPAEVLSEYMRGALVYLSTVKETFGITTLEALACGVPVVGWAYGGNLDIITDGYDGRLVKPNDYDALHEAIKDVLNKRVDYSAHARETAKKYDWSKVIGQYAKLYEQVLDRIQHEAHGVSIVITTHNYARYVPQAIDSALNQTVKPTEIIVVDDGSTDDTEQALTPYRSKVKIISQANAGVAAARTAGISAATQPYITCLDADDKLAPEFVETLLPAIDARRDLGIVYSGITLFDSQKSWPAEGFPPEFSWESQAMPHNPPSNCIPSACMFRKSMWFRAGPHQQEYAPGEDAEFWTRGLSVGFTAKKVSSDGLFWYRLHEGSASRRLKYCAIDDRLPWMTDKQFPFAAPSRVPPPVRSYSEPKVSVIIPVGPGHAQYAPAAIDSVIGQTCREWECIVVDDTRDLDSAWLVDRYPFIHYVFRRDTMAKAMGAGAARNAGIEQATAPLVLFLDADDQLAPTAIEDMLKAHLENNGRYIYADSVKVSASGETEVLPAADYEQRVWQADGLHAVTALVPTEWARKTLFDATLKTWEEGDFYTRLALAGYCGQHLAKPLLYWRDFTGKRHSATKTQKAAALKHQKQFEGMPMGSCCGGSGDALLAAKAAIEGMAYEPPARANGNGKTPHKMEYIGDKFGPITFIGNQGREYYGGVDAEHKYALVMPEDVKRLELSSQWKLVTA